MQRRLLTLILTCIFWVTSFAPVLAAGNAPLPAADKITVMEKILYGTEQSGSLIQRMDSMEDDVYGIATNDSILERVENMYDFLKGMPSNGEASLATRLNVVEWRLNQSMSGDPVKNRIEAVERLLYGQSAQGALSARLEELLRLTSYENGVVPVQATVLPKDSLLKVEFTQEVNSRQNRPGDPVYFKAADNLYVDNILVLPRGANGIGKIKKVRQPGMFGQDARIEIEFTHIYAVDGTAVPIFVGELAKQEGLSIAGAAGAAVGGALILGPAGVVGGAFVKGKAQIYPVGSSTFVQTVEDMALQGVVCPPEEQPDTVEIASVPAKKAEAEEDDEE